MRRIFGFPQSLRELFYHPDEWLKLLKRTGKLQTSSGNSNALWRGLKFAPLILPLPSKLFPAYTKWQTVQRGTAITTYNSSRRGGRLYRSSRLTFLPSNVMTLKNLNRKKKKNSLRKTAKWPKLTEATQRALIDKQPWPPCAGLKLLMRLINLLLHLSYRQREPCSLLIAALTLDCSNLSPKLFSFLLTWSHFLSLIRTLAGFLLLTRGITHTGLHAAWQASAPNVTTFMCT